MSAAVYVLAQRIVNIGFLVLKCEGLQLHVLQKAVFGVGLGFVPLIYFLGPIEGVVHEQRSVHSATFVVDALVFKTKVNYGLLKCVNVLHVDVVLKLLRQVRKWGAGFLRFVPTMKISLVN